jgi:leader peptidase (prepilin peptidase)/N-methyltransferase
MSGEIEVASTLTLAVILLRLSWIDMKEHRLPDIYTIPLILAGLIMSTAEGNAVLIASLIGGAIGFVVFAVIGQLFFVRTGREGLGLGDAKLFAAAGTWLGWAALPSVLLIASLSALVFALVANKRSVGIAFGPWIALGFIVVWYFQSDFRL